MGLENEKLISTICLRPMIYDKTNPAHSKKLIGKSAWEELAVECGLKVEEVRACQTRWKSLRDTYNKHANKGAYIAKSGDGLEEAEDVKPVTWEWYPLMQFLKDHNLPKMTTDNFTDSENKEDEQELIDLEASPPTSESDKTDERQQNTPKMGKGIKRTNQWYEDHAKRNAKSTLPGQWGTVIDKCTKLMESTSEPEKELYPFATYISSEMEK